MEHLPHHRVGSRSALPNTEEASHAQGTRVVEIYRIADSTHCDGLLMVYLPTERFLVEADVFTPAPPTAPPPSAVNPLSVNLAENISRLGLSVDQLLPLHGRMVPMAELNKAIGRAN